MIDPLKRRYAASAPDPVLPGYTQPKHPWLLTLRNRSALAALCMVGFVYGVSVAIFPVSLYVFLFLPLILLAALGIWALPEARSVPERAIERMFYASVFLAFLWPNYLAITLPGLPWITINRLISFPLVLTFIISLSMSSKMKSELGGVLREQKWITVCLCTFVFTQTYTLFLANIQEGINKFIDSQTQWTGSFLIACWLFLKPGRAEKFMRYLLICAALMLALTLIEWRLGYVPWKDHVPSFLHPNDEAIDRILTGKRRYGVDIYRVQGTFTNALPLAEFIAFMYSVVIYFLLTSKSPWLKAALVGYIPLAFHIILVTDSRAGSVGTAATLFIAAALIAYRRWKSSRTDLVSPAVLALYPLAVASFVALSLVWVRLRNMTWGGGQHRNSTDVRAEQWDKFWPALAKWPIGYGVDGPTQAGTISPSGVFTLDSYYIAQFLSYGVIGGFAYFGMFFVGAAVALKYGIRDHTKNSDLLLVAGIMLVVFLITKLVLVLDDSHTMIFMMLGMICALSSQRKDFKLRAPQRRETSSALSFRS